MIKKITVVCTLLIVCLTGSIAVAAPSACPNVAGVWDFTSENVYREIPTAFWPTVNAEPQPMSGCFIIQVEQTGCFITFDLFTDETGNCAVIDPDLDPIYGVGTGEIQGGSLIMSIGVLGASAYHVTGSVNKKGTGMSIAGSNFNPEKGCASAQCTSGVCSDGKPCDPGNPAVSNTMRAVGSKR